MKIKTKLLSVLGATAIASSSLGLIASCSFKPAPEPEPEEYTPPVVSYPSTGKRLFTTQSGSFSYTINHFKLNRKLLHGESIKVKEVNKSTAGATNIKVTGVSYDASYTSFSVNIKFEGEDLDPTQDYFGVFYFQFWSVESNGQEHLLGEEGVSDVGKDEFKLYFKSEQWDEKTISYSGPYNYDCKEEGNRIVNLWDDSTSTSDFTLNKPLAEGETISVKSTSANVVATIAEVDDTEVHVKFEVVNHAWTKDEEFVNFNLEFYITLNGALKKTQNDFGGYFAVKYHGTWQDNSVTFVHTSNQYQALTRPETATETVQARSEWHFKLARKLNANEKVEVKVLKIDGETEHTAISFVGKDPAHPWYTDRFLDGYFVYDPTKSDADDFNFVLQFTFIDGAGQQKKSPQVISADNTPKGRPFEFLYTAPWEDNYVTWGGSTKILDPGAHNLSSYLIGDHANETIDLHRQVVVANQESMKITFTGQDADKFVPLEEDVNWSYEKVGEEPGPFSYRVKINLMLKAEYADKNPHDYKFNLNFWFYEDGVLMQKGIPSVIDGLTFHYTVDPTMDIIMPHHIDTKETTFTFTASATEPMPEGYTLASLEMINGSGKPDETISLDSWTLGSDKRTITFTMTINPANAYSPEDWLKIQFSAHIAGAESYDLTTTDAFYIHYIAADNPYTEDDLAEYIRDRSFSFQVYNDNGYYGYKDDATDWYGDEWQASYLDDRDAQTGWILDDATLDDEDYTYYVVMTDRFRQKMTEIYSSAKTKMKIQVGDLNGNHTYTSGTGKKDKKYYNFKKEQKNPTGLKLGSTTDYFNLSYGTEFVWQNDLQGQTVKDKKGRTKNIRSDMAVAKISFDKICEGSTAYAKAIKAKLDKLNEWRKSKESIDPADPTQKRHTINSLLSERVSTTNRSKYKRFCTGGYPIGIYFNETDTYLCHPFPYYNADDRNVPYIDAYKNNVHIAESTLASESTLWYSSTNVNDFGSFYDHTALQSFNNFYDTAYFGSGDMDYYPNNPDWTKPTNVRSWGGDAEKFIDAAEIRDGIYHACSSQYTPINGNRSSKYDGSTRTYEPKLGYGARGSMAIIRKKDANDPRIYVVATFTNIYEDMGDWDYFWPVFDGFLLEDAAQTNILSNYIDHRI